MRRQAAQGAGTAKACDVGTEEGSVASLAMVSAGPLGAVVSLLAVLLR
ncbi:LrgB family protein [Dyella sp. ASV21]|nr:LrgB family protein [Dyella sp. ASV21]